MTASTRGLADRAKAIMQASDGLRKTAARCVAVACATSPSVDVARESLEQHITASGLRAAAVALLEELAADLGPHAGQGNLRSKARQGNLPASTRTR